MTLPEIPPERHNQNFLIEARKPYWEILAEERAVGGSFWFWMLIALDQSKERFKWDLPPGLADRRYTHRVLNSCHRELRLQSPHQPLNTGQSFRTGASACLAR